MAAVGLTPSFHNQHKRFVINLCCLGHGLCVTHIKLLGHWVLMVVLRFYTCAVHARTAPCTGDTLARHA